jgi:hypothetical protein
MRYLRTEDVALADIQVDDRLRPIDPEEVARIATSFGEIGQVTPIEVVEQQVLDEEPPIASSPARIVMRPRRRWAGRRSGRDQGAQHGQARSRAGAARDRREPRPARAQPAGSGDLRGRRRDVFVQLHPELSGRGGDRRSSCSAKRKSKDNYYPLIGDETAALLGRSAVLVKRVLRIYDRLAPDVRQRLRGTALSLVEKELYELTRYTPEQQRAIVDFILSGVAEPDVRRAAARIRGVRVLELAPHEAQVKRLREAWRGRAGGRVERICRTSSSAGVIPSFDPERL